MRSHLTFILLAGALAIAAVPMPGRAEVETARAGPTAPEVTRFRDEAFAAALLEETNRVRRVHGRRTLIRRRELEAAAGDQAVFMALTGRVQHASAMRGQATPADRVRRHGLEPRTVSENVAGYPLRPEEQLDTPTAVAAALVAQWMDSPPHRANLLNRDFRYFGAAVRFAPMIRTIWAAYGVQVFAVGTSPRG